MQMRRLLTAAAVASVLIASRCGGSEGGWTEQAVERELASQLEGATLGDMTLGNAQVRCVEEEPGRTFRCLADVDTSEGTTENVTYDVVCEERDDGGETVTVDVTDVS